jgi:hypothetical protein
VVQRVAWVAGVVGRVEGALDGSNSPVNPINDRRRSQQLLYEGGRVPSWGQRRLERKGRPGGGEALVSQEDGLPQQPCRPASEV